ncbi:MAG: PIN domain-containing protein [archaeon]
MKYFLDTYAIIEIIRGNPNYKEFFDAEIVTLKVNLAELAYHFLVSGDEKAMIEYSEKYSIIAKDIPFDIIVDAVKLKHAHKKSNLSYIDCLGYTYAKKNNCVFLTGDKEFEKTENVRFVK